MPERPPGAIVRTRVAAASALVSAVLFVALVSFLPIEVFGDAGHDDAWFWRKAESIAAGGWLGPYDQMTLMKGAGYPLFLAFTHVLGLSLMTTQALVYAAACLLLGAGVFRISGRPWLSLLLVLALQWHPAALAWSRVLRDNVTAAQALLVLACLLHLGCAAQAGRRGWGWAVLAGSTLAWLWLTREDGIWILPGVAGVLLALGWQMRRDRAPRRALALGVGLAAMIFVGVLSVVATVNLARYGVFATNDFKGPGFGDALSALQRVRVGEPVAYVPVPKKVREAVYAVSPTFARLRPHLDGNGRNAGSGDYKGGAFPWALRRAAASAGAYASAPTARRFHGQIADEVQRACDDGRLACAPEGFGLMPAVTAAQWQTLPERIGKAASMLVWQMRRDGWGGGHLDVPASYSMWEFVGRPRVLEDPARLGDRVSGWFRDPGGAWIRLRCADVGEPIAIVRRPSPDLVRHFGAQELDQNRFSVAMPAVDGCAFESTAGGGGVALAALARGHTFPLGTGQLRIDAIQPGISPSSQMPPAAWRIRSWIGYAYAVVLPWLAGAGLLAFGWTSVRALRQRRLDPLHMLAAAAWVLVASRLLLLLLVDVSAFPGLRVHYMQPAFPLALLAAVASLALLTSDRGSGRQR